MTAGERTIVKFKAGRFRYLLPAAAVRSLRRLAARPQDAVTRGDASAVAWKFKCATNRAWAVLVAVAVASSMFVFIVETQAAAATWSTIERVSVAPSQSTTDGTSEEPASSWDGRFVAFSSRATNLVVGDTNGRRDIFVKDRATGSLQIVSRPEGGGESNGDSREPSISGDGRFVAFTSSATNLVPNDRNSVDDVFVKDLQTGAVELVSVNSAGDQANFASGSAVLSHDGRYVVFQSVASNLSPNDSNGNWDIFIRDRQAGVTKRVTNGVAGASPTGASERPSVSLDARYVAFESTVSEWDPADTNAFRDVYVADVVSGTVVRASVPQDPSLATDGDSTNPSISLDGRRVAFVSWASNLAPGDLPSEPEVFLRDLASGTTVRASLADDESPVPGGSWRESLSGDGNRVTFQSPAVATPSDTNPFVDVYVRDMATGSTSLVSVYAGQQLNDDALKPSISGDGRFVGYETAGTFLSGWPDADGNTDVYLGYSGEAEVPAPDPPAPLPPFVPGDPPTAPSGLRVNDLGEDFVDLAWDDNSTDELLFKLERKLAGGSYQEIARLQTNLTGYLDTGLQPGTTYVYRVRAANTEANSAYSDELTVTTTGGVPPAAPSDLTATPLDPYSVRLDWVDNATNESAFTVERRDPLGAFEPIATLGRDSVSHTDVGLSPLHTYVYRVKAENSAGSSAYSNEVTVTTPSPSAPEAPSDLRVSSVGARRVSLTWTDNSAREDGFRIQRATEGGSYSTVATVGTDVTAYEDVGLSDSTRYSYRVVAFNVGGDSPPSNVAGILTKSAATCRLDGIVFTKQSTVGTPEVFLTTLDRSWVKRITSTAASEEEPVLSGNGSEVWFSSAETGRRKLFSVDTDGTSRRIRSEPGRGDFDDWAPSLWSSADGTRNLVTFVSNRDGSSEIYVMNTDGSGLRKLTSYGVGERRLPRFWPDGASVTFASDHTGTFRLYRVPVTGGTASEIASSAPGNQVDGDVSTDGRWLVYVSDRWGGGARLTLRDLGSGAERPLGSSSLPLIERPRFSRDARHVYFSALDYDANWNLLRVDVESSVVSAVSATQDHERMGDVGLVAPSEAARGASFFAEGATEGGFSTWLLLANSGTTTARGCLTLLTESGPKRLGLVDVPARSRLSVDLSLHHESYFVGAVVESVVGSVRAERAMYATGAGRSGAHLSKGAGSASKAWYTAEGATAAEFETWLLVSNPGSATARVDVGLATAAGQVDGPVFDLAPGGRVSIRVDDYVPDSYDVAATVTSNRPVVVERATYANGSEHSGATASPASAAQLPSWFLGEGATAGGFETWILVANHGDSAACVAITLFVGGEAGGAQQIYGGSRPPLCMGGHQRRSINLGWFVNSYDVAARVDSVAGSDGTYTASVARPVVVERAMYHNEPRLGRGASTAEGSPAAGTRWLAVEGATAGGFETWILLANPGTLPACVESSHFVAGVGVVPDPRANPICLAGGSRVSLKVDDVVPDSYDVSTLVRSVAGSSGGLDSPVPRPVIVEHSIYTPPRMSGDSTSGPAVRLG